MTSFQFRDMYAWSGSDYRQELDIANLAIAYYVLGKWAHCIEAFREKAKAQSNGFEFWKELGDAYYQIGNYNGVIETYKNAVDKFPMDSLMWSGLGYAYKAKGDYDGAIETFKNAAEKFPMDSLIWSGLGNAYKAKGHSRMQWRRFQRTIRCFYFLVTYMKSLARIVLLCTCMSRHLKSYEPARFVGHTFPGTLLQ